jgi:hypothetical protein
MLGHGTYIFVSDFILATLKSPHRAFPNQERSHFTKEQTTWGIYKVGEVRNINKLKKLKR